MRDAWRELEVERSHAHGFEAYEAATATDHWRAPTVEYGPEPHATGPEDAEAIDTPEGPRARAKHPGYPGAHMLARAVAEVEAKLPELMAPELQAGRRQPSATPSVSSA